MKIPVLKASCWIASRARPPSPPAPANTARRGDRDRGDGRDPHPGDDLRDRERQLDPPEQLALGHPHAPPGVLARGRDVGEPGDDVAVDDLQRVEDEGDDRGDVAASGDRQQEQEQGDARDRVDHPGDAGEGRDQPAAAVRDQRQAERDHEPDRDRGEDEHQVLERRGDVVADVVDDVAEADGVVLADAAGRPLPGLADEAAVALGERHDDREQRRHQSGSVVTSGRSAAGCSSLSASSEVRNSEMISTESTPAIRPSPSTTGA